MTNANPFSNWVIQHQFPDATQPQPTAAEFGATLPGDATEPPNGGNGGNMPTCKNVGRVATNREGSSDKARVAFFTTEKVTGGRLRAWIGESDLIDIPGEATELSLVQYVEEPDEPENPNPPDVLELPRGTLGVDVSAWQGNFDWSTAVANGVRYGIIRCSDGLTKNTSTHDTNGIDVQFWSNAQWLHDNGLPWAIYHFLRPGDVATQADKVLGVMTALYENGTDPRTAVFEDDTYLPEIWIDVEDASLSPSNILDFYNRRS
jgi:hypothetical protein